MSKEIGKKAALVGGVALGITVVLLIVATVLVMNGVVTAQQIPLWALRLAGLAVGCIVVLRPAKHKRRKRRGGGKQRRKRLVT